MPTFRGPTNAPGLLALFALVWAVGCPQQQRLPSRPAPTPRIAIAEPRIEARTHPAFRLIVRGNSLDEASRLVAIDVHIKNIHDIPLSIRPDLIRVELPDGSTSPALDQPRAKAILQRTRLARADLYYLEEEPRPRAGGISGSERSRLQRYVGRRLLDNTRLGPGEIVTGYVVVDTRKSFEYLGGSVVEIVAHPSEPGGGQGQKADDRYPVRVLLGAPIDPPEA